MSPLVFQTPDEVALTVLLERVHVWDSNPQAVAAHRVHAVNDVRHRITVQATLPPAARWAYLARHDDPDVVGADGGATARTWSRSSLHGGGTPEPCRTSVWFDPPVRRRGRGAPGVTRRAGSETTYRRSSAHKPDRTHRT
jgi:hypothetical protein